MASTVQFIGVSVIDFIAFALALVAEQTRDTAKVAVDYDFNYNLCVYDSNIATVLGIAAAALLLLAQTLKFMWFRKDHKIGCCGIFLSIICWVIFLISEAFLLVGSVKNSERTKYRTIFSDEPPNCNTLKKGVFEIGAVFVMITSLLSNWVSIFFFDPNIPNTEMGSYTLLLP